MHILNRSGEEVAKTVSDDNGEFALEIGATNVELTAIIVKTDYKEGKTTFVGDENMNAMTMNLIPSKSLATIGDDMVAALNMPTIYFNFDRDNLRADALTEMEKIIGYMNDYPELKLEIKSHTDSRGDDAYNLYLSERRAKATKAYLVSKGIAAEQLIAKGYGETQSKNDCFNASRCSSAQHELNRRTEFILVPYTN
ncbi:MAG: OmpA family protein [Cryomorphaceae bacterium]